MSMQRQALSTLSTFWDSTNIKGTGQEITNPHVLAKGIVSSGEPITAEDINKVLAHKGISVTEEELELLKTVKPVRIPLDPSHVGFVNTLTAIEVKALNQKCVIHVPRGRPPSTTFVITINYIDGEQLSFPNVRSART